MSEPFININKACAVTGHRFVDKSFDVDYLEQVFIKVIETGIDTFLIGMALGFDALCFNTLYKLKKKYDIKLIACIPCENQDLKFTEKQKMDYHQMLMLADEKVYISKNYTSRCMQKRNEYMVNHSSVLVNYLRRNFGGTFNTVEYAKNKGNVTVIDI